MSKAAVIHMTRAMALEWGRYGINVNAICPGYIDTEINHHQWQTESGKKFIESMPRKRIGEPADLDTVLMMLCANESHFINGAVSRPTTASASEAAGQARSMRPLSLLEARVLGVLVEKSHTVPDSYPLSLNSLTLGCNQKTARDPVISASEGEVQGAVDALKSLSLAFESSGSRVTPLRAQHGPGAGAACRNRSRCWRR